LAGWRNGSNSSCSVLVKPVPGGCPAARAGRLLASTRSPCPARECGGAGASFVRAGRRSVDLWFVALTYQFCQYRSGCSLSSQRFWPHLWNMLQLTPSCTPMMPMTLECCLGCIPSNWLEPRMLWAGRANGLYFTFRFDTVGELCALPALDAVTATQEHCFELRCGGPSRI
jgi:hypothetical protein